MLVCGIVALLLKSAILFVSMCRWAVLCSYANKLPSFGEKGNGFGVETLRGTAILIFRVISV